MMAWWAVLGLGLGLIMLSALIWMRQDVTHGRAQALEDDLQRLAPLVARLRAGEAPTADVARQADHTLVAPLMHAMAEASRMRQQSLVAYQAQIVSAGLGEALTPGNLAMPAGRVSVRQTLNQLEAALQALATQDAAVQARLDASVQQWLRDVPQWGDPSARQSLAQSTASTAGTMATFFQTERDIVAQVLALLSYLDKIDKGVMLEGSGASQQLVFSKAADLEFYRSALMQLGYLGRHEQESLSKALQASGVHARRVGDLLAASAPSEAGDKR
ncbi:MAG: hypothetical protein EOP40_05355 [Rubrivivax sp.]|nr:MAG: hypothetical protein EOP40_05355 [Rubrivivax sp.]